MKSFKCYIFAFMVLSIVSCGGKKSNATTNESTCEVTVDNTTISGKLSSYFSLVDKTYRYEKGIIDKVNVELKCIAPLPEDLIAYIGIDILDENGTVISVAKPDGWSFSDYDILRQATPDQIVTIRIDNHDNVGEETPAKIRLSSIVKEDDKKSESSSLSNDDNSSDDDITSISDDSDDDISVFSSSDSEDWDELLTSYEQYVDKYISYVKKATKGDMTALAEYPSLMKKAEELSDKLERAQEKMSASQWARYNKITMKMLEAAQETVPTQSPLDME